MKSIADSLYGLARAKILGASVSILKLNTQGTKASPKLTVPGCPRGFAFVIVVPAARSVPWVMLLGGVVKMNGRAPPPSVTLSALLPGIGKPGASGPIFHCRHPNAAIPGSQNQPA